MNLFRNFAVAAGIALASNGAFADEAVSNTAACMGFKDRANWYELPEGKEQETCSCVGKHASNMKRLAPQVSSTDLIRKGYHQCLSTSAISAYYFNYGYQSTVASAGESAAKNYASCMKTEGLMQGMRFATDSRTNDEVITTAEKKCQYLLNVNSLIRMFQ